MQETYAEQARKMQEWMIKEGIEAHVERLPDGRAVIIPGPKLDRTRQALWDAKNLITVSCRVPVETAETFRQACKREGETPYSVLREFVEVIVKEERRTGSARLLARPGGPPPGVAGSPSGRPLRSAPRTITCHAGSPRGRSPRAPWSMPSGQAGRRKPEPAQPYDWEKEGDSPA